MSYIGTEPKDIRSFGRTKFDYTASQGQTAFTGADDDGKVLAFTVGQIEVYVNGILMDDSDFTTTGTGTVTLASAANLNDVVNVVSFETNIPDSNYVPASGGTFTGAVTHTGSFTSKGIDDNADATAVTIDASERVGIGATPKAQHSNVTDALNVGSSNIFQRTKDGYIGSNFYYNASDVGKSIASGYGTLYHQDVTNGRHNFLVTSASAGAADATHSLATELTIDGDGLKFNGDTAAANALDDYEEGNCTLTWHGSGGTSNTTSSNFKYVKVGGLVHVSGNTTSATPNATGTLELTGLPFTADANSNGAIMYRNLTHDTNQHTLTAYTPSGAAKIQPYWSGQGQYDRLESTDWNSGASIKDMYISVVYKTTQ